jgi:molybdopterin-guanine dinucleotide biosynthesis protein A
MTASRGQSDSQCYYSLMQRSGFVLAGGASSRMGRDKALLPYHGSTLVQHVARAVEQAAGNVALIGPIRYGSLGYPVYPDKVRGCGPLGGLYTALSVSGADWNLIVACDMPGVSVDALRGLLDAASESSDNCIIAHSPVGDPEPLCGVYHRACLPVIERAIQEKRFRMRDLMAQLQARLVDGGVISNVNTPAEWADFKTNPL